MTTKLLGRTGCVRTATLALVGMAVVITARHEPVRAQAFSSGSDGSDGALTIAANQGTIVFDPAETARWGRVLDADGDGVYNFTTITVNAGSTLKLQGDRVNRPVYWLASGDAVVAGTLDVSGAIGAATSDLSIRRQVAVPGSGGYSGGAGGSLVTSQTSTPGDGPGGGSGGVQCDVPSLKCGKGGAFSGNRYLIPLVGGSGGEGGTWNNAAYYGGGGGGGAILIASSTGITINGAINASGGATVNFGGGGAGGAIRLVAPTLAGSGQLNVSGGLGGYSPLSNGGPGMVRLEALSGGPSFALPAGGAFVTRGSPVDASTLRPASSVRIAAIDGIPVPVSPSGSFALPDVTINKNLPVAVAIQASGIPPGTVVTLQVLPQTPPNITDVFLPTVQATLTGTQAASTATFSFTFPYGFSRGSVRASWTQ